MNKLTKSVEVRDLCLVCPSDQEILKVLRDLSHASVLPSAKSSGNLPADKVHSSEGKFPRTGWWISKVALPQTIKKHQDVSSYNLNSFGLRYGK